MAFDGTEGEEISLETAADYTSAYRENNPGEINGHFYGKDVLNDLLNQEGCVGIRMYYGIDDKGQKQLVLVGADANENDMTSLVVDVSKLCPPRCGRANALNS